MKLEFWRGKKVFLTGHTGFKGSWLSLWLARLGAQVHGYALPPPTQPSLFSLTAADRQMRSTIGDIRQPDQLASELIAFQPDIVLHLAAQSLVLQSYEDPLATYASNVMGTANLLNAVRQLTGRCAVVNVTTDKVYANRGWVWGYRETDRLGGRDPYSNSKACAELVASAFYESFFADAKSRIGVANARAGNVIGGGDWTPRQLIPEAIASFTQGRPVALRHPDAVRPWQHVLDCLSGYLTLAEALYADPERFSEGWNFGPAEADALSVARIVDLLARHWSLQRAWVSDPVKHAHEEPQLRLDSQKAARELNWMGRLKIETALEWTATWFLRYASGASARVLCEEQIDRYMQSQQIAG